MAIVREFAYCNVVQYEEPAMAYSMPVFSGSNLTSSLVKRKNTKYLSFADVSVCREY